MHAWVCVGVCVTEMRVGVGVYESTWVCSSMSKIEDSGGGGFGDGGGGRLQGLHLLPPVHLLHLIKAAPSLSPGSQAPWTLQAVHYLDLQPFSTKKTRLGHRLEATFEEP